ncbi:unnamed protein product [Onchocerca flexuosa]|uniref:BESS domain-containing protein n=1 Tax=Onchocerca flexuosa TaxID=387005 RepID=A0A183H027_9BILA|nr:unnamed protein product [Onchocerca flexuosa]
MTMDSASSSTPAESSSFEQRFHDRMKVLNFTKQKLDFEMEKLCVRSHSQPLNYIHSILSNAKISDLEKPVSRNYQESGHETQRFQEDSSITKTDPVHEKMVEMEESVVRTIPNIEKYLFPLFLYVIQNVEVEMKNNSLEKHAVDPLMVRYMKMIEDQREKVESVIEQTPKKEDVIT